MKYRSEPVEILKGVGEKALKILNKKKINTIDDLLTYYPKDYITHKPYKETFNEALEYETPLLVTAVSNPKPTFNGKFTITKCTFEDAKGNRVSCSWFNRQSVPISRGDNVVLDGTCKRNGEFNNITQPVIYNPEEYVKLTKRPDAVYSLTKGVTQNFFKTHIKTAISTMEKDEKLKLPKEILERRTFLSAKECFWQIHFPESEEKNKIATNCLAYEELFDFFYKLESDRTEKHPNKFAFGDYSTVEKFVKNIPFRLTNDQQQAISDIMKDMQGENIAERLVQGDVGSGKTLVAFCSLVFAVSNGYQGVLLAPTSVLATQHYKELLERADGLGLNIRLLTNETKAKEKREIVNEIKNNIPTILIATHSVINVADNFPNLALVVIDEQHKFGVEQRDALLKNNPHIISMTATPIPRSLARTLFGTNKISEIKTKPAGRKPVITKSFAGKKNLIQTIKMLEYAKSNGNQSYVVCPAITESESDNVDLLNVDEVVEFIKKNSNLKVIGVHGKTKNKDEIMEQYANGEYDVLVSTTVIEVGVNVPNATVIVVVNAERFGLATLHQLRGRVGRGSDQAYCILLDCINTFNSCRRMNIMTSTNDGFKISEQDLQMRGPGEIFGVEQSGLLTFKIADIYNERLVKLVKNDVNWYKNNVKCSIFV